MIDSHCHLDHEPLYENINDIILRSKKVGITKLLTICTNLESFENIKKIINLIQLFMELLVFIHMMQINI